MSLLMTVMGCIGVMPRHHGPWLARHPQRCSGGWMAQFTKVASRAEIPAGAGKVVEAGGRAIAVFNCDGTFYAVDNTCRHRGGPLGEGSLSGTTVTCPWHGWEYDVATGACRLDPSLVLQRFEVKLQGDDVLVAV